jgi:hypothetical protein
VAESVLSRFFSRLTGSRREDALARYVIAEAGKGRDLAEILDDPFVKNRADETTLLRLMDHPEVVDAVGGGAVARLRAALASRP